jgi:hypothetical protein
MRGENKSQKQTLDGALAAGLTSEAPDLSGA